MFENNILTTNDSTGILRTMGAKGMLSNALREGESGGSLYLHVSKRGGGPGTGVPERIRT